MGAKVLEACRGVTLPAGKKAPSPPLQHCDLLLDILLVRALCATAGEDARALDRWLAAVSAHSTELAKGAGGAGGRAETYAAIASCISELYRADQKESGIAARHAKARKQLKELQPKWPCLGGTEEQRGVLLEAMEGHPIVCGEPEFVCEF